MGFRERPVFHVLGYRHILQLVDLIEPKTCCRVPKGIADHSHLVPQDERLKVHYPVRLFTMSVFGPYFGLKTLLVPPPARMVLDTSVRPLQLQLASPSSFHRSLRIKAVPYADNSSLCNSVLAIEV